MRGEEWRGRVFSMLSEKRGADRTGSTRRIWCERATCEKRVFVIDLQNTIDIMNRVRFGIIRDIQGDRDVDVQRRPEGARLVRVVLAHDLTPRDGALSEATTS